MYSLTVCGAVDAAVDSCRSSLRSCFRMRGVQFACVYWLLAAIYLFAALGSAVASGEISTAVSLQLAAKLDYTYTW